MVKLSAWLPIYFKIANEMGYSVMKDQFSAEILSFLILGKSVPLRVIHNMIHGKRVFVFGAGPSLREDLEKLTSIDVLNKFVKISADGATSALAKFRIRPELVVTDLDGNIRDILKVNKLGSIVVIHAHGDNLDKLLRLSLRFNRIVGTTQVIPAIGVYDFGGFTDGDRCVFLAEEFGAREIYLAGMDFGEEIGEFSKRVYSKEIKIKKLRIGLRLLEWLSEKSKSRLYNFTSGGIEIKGFKRVGLNDLRCLNEC